MKQLSDCNSFGIVFDLMKRPFHRQCLSAAAKPDAGEAKGKPSNRGSECEKLIQKLTGFIDQRAEFQKTVNLSQDRLNTWQTFFQDGVSGLMGQLTSLNQKIQEMPEDPRMQKYFEADAPELKVLLDDSTSLS